jgi:hypothetical protein
MVPELNLEDVPEFAAQVRIHVLDLKFTSHWFKAQSLGEKLHVLNPLPHFSMRLDTPGGTKKQISKKAGSEFVEEDFAVADGEGEFGGYNGGPSGMEESRKITERIDRTTLVTDGWR